MILKVKCPYCKLEQRTMAEQGENLIYCDIEQGEGGCENMFLVDVKLIPEVTIYELTEVKE